MMINRYRANSLKAAMDKAFAELGPDAKILHVRQLDGYEFGSEHDSQSSERVEIIAVVDDVPIVEKTKNQTMKNTSHPSVNMLVEDDYISDKQSSSRTTGENAFSSRMDRHVHSRKKGYKTLSEALRMYTNASSSNLHESEPPAKQSQHVEKRKKDDVNKRKKGSIATPSESEERNIYVENPKAFSVHLERSPKSYEPSGNKKQNSEYQELLGVSKSRISHVLHECLIRNQVNSDLAYEILSLLNDEACNQKEPSARGYLSAYMERMINVSKGLDKSKRVTILIGPTGVGKTTTLAKLAAQYHIQKEKNVGLITIDAYRIAAIDQLKIYAQIMSIPLKVALTPEQLWKCIDEYDDMDLILVDTPGRSHLNKNEVKNIEEFLEAAQPADTHLLISASTKDNDAYTIVETFAPEYVQKFIFTKLDETLSFGSILNISVKLKKPISYLTTGQNVPDDIRLADIDFLVDLFVTKNRVKTF